MSREPDEVKLKVLDDGPPPQQKEIVRLIAPESGAGQPIPALRTPTSPRPADFPAQRLVASPSQDERRTHEPGIDSLVEQEVEAVPLEDTWSDGNRPQQPVPWGWFVLIGLIGAGAVTWSYFHVKANAALPQAARQQSLAALKKAEEENAAASDQVDEMLKTAKAYLAADSVEKLLPRVRDPGRVKPLMEAWYQHHPLKPDRFLAQQAFQPLEFETPGSFWIVGCSTASGANRRFIMESLPDGKGVIDWEYDVCYQPMDWDAYAADRPAGSLDFRVQLSPDTFHSDEFADSSKWLGFKLTAPGGSSTLYGYVGSNTELAAQIMSLYQRNNGSPVALILRLGIPTGLKSPKGVVIEKLMSPHWIYLEPPGA